jgi:Zn-dependent oligopeptidase
VEIARPNGKLRESNEFISQNCWTSGCKAKVEAKEIQDLIDAQNGGFKLEPWDWNFIQNKFVKPNMIWTKVK